MFIIDKIKLRNNPIKYWRKKGAIIGDDCNISDKAFLGSEPYLISIGDHVRINSGVQLITHDGGVWVLRKLQDTDNAENLDLFGKINIKNNVHIGTNSIIMPGTTIGNNCIIGCGAIVTHDIPDNSIAVGVPARVIETVYDYKKKHSDEFLYTKSLSQDEKRSYLKNYFTDSHNEKE